MTAAGAERVAPRCVFEGFPRAYLTSSSEGSSSSSSDDEDVVARKRAAAAAVGAGSSRGAGSSPAAEPGVGGASRATIPRDAPRATSAPLSSNSSDEDDPEASAVAAVGVDGDAARCEMRPGGPDAGAGARATSGAGVAAGGYRSPSPESVPPVDDDDGWVPGVTPDSPPPLTHGSGA